MKDVMEPDNEFKWSKGKNDPEVFKLNQHKVRSALGHPEVIIGIPVKPGIHRMIALNGLVDSCSTGTIIYPTVLKHIKYEIEQGEESEWKTMAGVMQKSGCLKIEKAVLPSIMVSRWFYSPQALHIMPNTEQPYQIILGQDFIRAIKLMQMWWKVCFNGKESSSPCQDMVIGPAQKSAHFVKTIPSWLWSQSLLNRMTSCKTVIWVIRHYRDLQQVHSCRFNNSGTPRKIKIPRFHIIQWQWECQVKWHWFDLKLFKWYCHGGDSFENYSSFSFWSKTQQSLEESNLLTCIHQANCRQYQTP